MSKSINSLYDHDCQQKKNNHPHTHAKNIEAQKNIFKIEFI